MKIIQFHSIAAAFALKIVADQNIIFLLCKGFFPQNMLNASRVEKGKGEQRARARATE